MPALHLSAPAQSGGVRQKDRRFHTLALAALPAAVAVVLYWPTLKLPLLYDDLLHIRIAKDLTLASVWVPTEAFGFYRPLTFFPLLMIKGLFGHYPPTLLHGINVAQHALNASLITLLAWRLWSKPDRALLAGLLLALFPFSYQAVAVYGHNVHPATAGLILLALHTYLAATGGRRRIAFWWILTGLLFLLALLSHESAVLFGPFAALVHWARLQRISKPEFRRLARQPWFIFTLVGVAYLAIYQFLPLSRAPQAGFEGGALWTKFLYLVQSAGYPLTWFGRFAPDDPLADAILVLVGLGLALLLTLWSGRNKANRPALLLGWGWWGLASLLIAIPLSAGYLLHGPRLLYLGSVGLALLWPMLLEPVAERPRTGRLVWVAIVLFLLSTNWLFVRGRLVDYERLTEPVNQVKEVMSDRPTDEGVLLVNLPAWLAPLRNTYPVGVEFVAMMGDYLFVEELIGENLGIDRPVWAIEVADLLGSPAYGYGIHIQSTGAAAPADWAPAGSHIFIVTYGESGPETRYTGMLRPESVGDLALATAGPYALLAAEAAQCERLVTLNTTWYLAPGSPESALSPTTSIFAQLLDNQGRLVSQADGPLLGLRPDLLGLAEGWLALDRRQLDVPADDPGQVLLGVYDFAGGGRYPAVDVDGSPLPDDALSLPLGDCPDG